jgi:hypothetical protein
MPSDRVKFGDDLELDRAVYELRRPGRALKLERFPMEILLLLVERSASGAHSECDPTLVRATEM